jgi:metal-responsive CopG/Arc/MetJ family transcriptional regulator
MAAANHISLPERLMAEVQAAAEERHISVEEVVEDAVKKYFEDRSCVKMLEYGQSRAKALGYTEDNVERLIAETRAEKRAR